MKGAVAPGNALHPFVDEALMKIFIKYMNVFSKTLYCDAVPLGVF